MLGAPQEAALPHYTISDGEVAEHTNRLEQALINTRQQIAVVQQRVGQAMGTKDAAIFDAHLLILDDPVLLDEVSRMMREEHLNVERAFATAGARYVAALDALKDEYFRERVADIRDVIARVLSNLLGKPEHTDLSQISEPCILVAHDLTPSRTALLDKRKVLGFATDQGSRTSHTAILARSLQIPAVTGLVDVSQRMHDGQYALLDGINGLLILNPTEQTLFEYGQLEQRQLGIRERLSTLKELPAVTLDGRRVSLSANIESPGEVPGLIENGAEGVGLFRTEYLFLNRDTLPTEQEQYEAYYQTAMALRPQSVIIRTMDLGGDKYMPQDQAPSEHNPFLGWRAIRICLQEQAMFRDQLRAVLRASVAGNLKLMYPMITGLEEIRQANALVEQCKTELRQEGVPFDENLAIGVMIEIPAAAMMAPALAQKVAFFSIGTNDLIQYTLAVDRLNPKIAHLYEPTHPAVVRLIKTVAEAAHARGIWVGVCGEMAGDPVLVPLLLGLGVDELSLAASGVPAVKFVIRRLKMEEAGQLAEFALQCESGAEILARAQALSRQIAPDLFEN